MRRLKYDQESWIVNHGAYKITIMTIHWCFCVFVAKEHFRASSSINRPATGYWILFYVYILFLFFHFNAYCLCPICLWESSCSQIFFFFFFFELLKSAWNGSLKIFSGTKISLWILSFFVVLYFLSFALLSFLVVDLSIYYLFTFSPNYFVDVSTFPSSPSWAEQV